MKRGKRGEPAYKVLILDDEPEAVQGIQEVIRAAVPDCKFVSAETVEQALGIMSAADRPFDLAVVDIKLRGAHTGIRLMEPLAPSKPLHPWTGQTRVIVYTAYPKWETAREAYEAGASTFISKLEKGNARKLADSAKALLKLRDLHETWRGNFAAQRAAEQSFAKNRARWTKRYAGKFLVVRDGKVVRQFTNVDKLFAHLEKQPLRERLQLGVIRVSPPEEHHGAD